MRAVRPDAKHVSGRIVGGGRSVFNRVGYDYKLKFIEYTRESHKTVDKCTEWTMCAKSLMSDYEGV